ncbi:MAG: hypothetical protein AAFN70_13125, partial [Planctomycetota bacterium]
MKRYVTHLSLCFAAVLTAAIGCTPARHNLPPAQRLLEPGPGVGGPGPGVMMGPAVRPGIPPGGAPMGAGLYGDDSTTKTTNPDASQAADSGGIAQVGFTSPAGCPPTGDGDLVGPAMMGGPMMPMGPMVPPTVQVTFGRPDAMEVRYSVSGGMAFDSQPLIVPARQNFPQGGLYRLKLTNIENRPGVELYPTVELAIANPHTGAYLAHNSIPIQFDAEDFDQVVSGNFVTKVIYLPDPEFQGPALAGIETIVSTRLDPGVDPIVEADNRGSILAIVRLGDKDIEMAGDPSMSMGMGAPMAGPITGLPMPFAPASESCGGACVTGGASRPPSLPGMIAGVTAPQYGMPITGTPIGLPGPPHIPLGAPAGLKKH